MREYAAYGVKDSTLRDAVRGCISPSKPPGPKPTLGLDLEDGLAEWVTQMALLGFAPTKRQLMIKAKQVAEQMCGLKFKTVNGLPGKRWYRRWLKAHPRVSERTSALRKRPAETPTPAEQVTRRRGSAEGAAGPSSSGTLSRWSSGVSDGRVDLHIPRSHDRTPRHRQDLRELEPGAIDVEAMLRDPKSVLTTDERKLLEALRLQITRRTVLTLPQAAGTLATPAPSRPALLDLAPSDDEADEAAAAPVGKHHRKITVARWLTHDDSLEAFREKEAAKAAKEAGDRKSVV